MNTPRLLFITGTDTGVGKTVLTGLLLSFLREHGVHALPMKPFCSGGRGDVVFLHRLSDREISPVEINPFYFPEPVAPLVAARKHRQPIVLEIVMEKIQALAARCEFLLVEGAGGLMVPLGDGFTVADLICRLGCDVQVVAANRLGAINHTLLTVHALVNRRAKSESRAMKMSSSGGAPKLQVTLMDHQAKNLAGLGNRIILAEFLRPIPLTWIRYLGPRAMRIEVAKKNQKKVEKTLATILGMH